MKTGIVGAGISGVSIARMLQQKKCDVKIFEQKSDIGGLIRCEVEKGYLYHKVGGHLFNSKNEKVLDWFWSHFDKENEFIQARRNAKIWMNAQYIGYPIENFLYSLPSETVQKILIELTFIQTKPKKTPGNFEEFLRQNFGDTLYDIYFGLYNHKIWNTDLSQVPLEWLEGKLPMPDFNQILMSNIFRKEETQMVHSYFYYPIRNGSQFIIDRLSEGICIDRNARIDSLVFSDNQWLVNGSQSFDHLVYTGDIRSLTQLLRDKPEIEPLLKKAEKFKSNGTTNLLCECDVQDISWLYLPEKHIKAHRIIYTGNFSSNNNAPGSGRSSCVVEFSGFVQEEAAIEQLSRLPGNLRFLSSHYEPDSYIIHNQETASIRDEIRKELKKKNLHLLGRFAEWEYYNMDKCMEAAMALCEQLTD
jgi:protoporphyrinogen oxidase